MADDHADVPLRVVIEEFRGMGFGSWIRGLVAARSIREVAGGLLAGDFGDRPRFSMGVAVGAERGFSDFARGIHGRVSEGGGA